VDQSALDEHFAGIDAGRRDDVRRLHELIRDESPGLDVEVVNGMVGYGRYHYRYASGRGFAPDLAGQSQAVHLAVRELRRRWQIPGGDLRGTPAQS
jgi:hypothetical protein